MPILPLLVEAWIISFLIKSSVANSKKYKQIKCRKQLQTKFKQKKIIYKKHKSKKQSDNQNKQKQQQQRKNIIPCKCF